MRSAPILGNRSRVRGDARASGFFAAGLIYGQVKKAYRRRKLVGVTYVMRCGTRVALKTRLQALGLSGKLNTAFVERIKKDATAERGSAAAANLVHRPASAAVADASGLVAGLLPFRAPTRVAPGG